MKVIKGNFLDKNKGAEITKNNLEKQGHRVTINEDVPYSAMLLDLIKPYLETTPHFDDLERILELGVMAWNMATSKSIGLPGFKQMFDATLKTAGIIESGVVIVKQIMITKQQKYAEHGNFIEDFELNEDENGMMHVSVISKSIMDFMNDIDLDDKEIEDLQYEEGFINRNALVVKPTPAFWNWFKENDKDFTEPQLPVKHSIYLINEKDSDDETAKWLKKNFDRIFINELEGWITDKEYWPKKRTYKMFNEFFEIEFNSMVMDLENEPVIKD